MLPSFWGAKNRPKDKYYFLNKVFENITDQNTDLTIAL